MRLAIDFGNTHTVAAVAVNDEHSLLPLPGLSFPNSALIPSLIFYAEPENVLLGHEVVAAGKETAPTTFRWMKRYLALNSPYVLRIGQARIPARDAVIRFLTGVLTAAERAVSPEKFAELIFTVPVDSFDFYRDLLKSAFETPARAVRVIDEVSAAAMEADVTLGENEPVFLLDIGGSTQQCMIATRDEDGRISVRGKAGRVVGGSNVDRWIFEYFCRMHGAALNDPVVRRHGAALLKACETLKIGLSTDERAAVHSVSFEPNSETGLSLTRGELDMILERADFLAAFQRMLFDVQRQAEANGVDLSLIRNVFAVGGTTRIPRLRRALSEAFPNAALPAVDPMTAVALGAARIGGNSRLMRDRITHEYAVRYRDGKSGSLAFETIVPAGSVFPSDAPVRTLRLKAARQGQRLFGLAIFERSLIGDDAQGDAFELLFDEQGGLLFLSSDTIHGADDPRKTVFLNPHGAEFIEASPPAAKGETRFSVEFRIDANRFLTVRAVDLRDGRVILEDMAVVKLS